jgi:hypothetical protein
MELSAPADVRHGGHRALVAFARAGYFAKGAVYVGIGVLAGLAALGRAEGRITGVDGMLQALVGHPFGSFALAVVAAALAGHVMWRFWQGIADPARKGSGPKALVMRGGYIVSGLVYASAVSFALKTLAGQAAGGGGSDDAPQQTATLMSQPGGVWLVGAAGACVVGVGLYQLHRAWRASFEDKWTLASSRTRCWATRLSRFGIAARAIVFLICGGFLAQAAWRADPSEAKGLGGALAELASQPFGRYLLGAAAAGLVCYGIYCVLNARYRRIVP